MMGFKGFMFQISGFTILVKRFLFLCLFVFSVSGFSQEGAEVKAEIDTASIKIGEQIQYKITVETDSANVVYFPEDQTFSPLEMVEALTIDTTKIKGRVMLQRIYALTQFDSGSYTIPKQRVAINEKAFLTDSFRIQVADVAVDTTKQNLYDIKPLIEVNKSNAELWMTILWIAIALLIIGALVYWFFLRKKPLTEEEKVALLPPFDRAMLQLKELENSRYLIQDEYKKYYSELTDIVRSYLEEDVHVSALESTTGELITKLELLKDAGELDLEDETIIQFQKVLQTADLVKFAKSKPSSSVAEQDRTIVEQIVQKTKEALPEPTEEEMMLDEEYLEELERKKRRKRIYTAAAVFGGLIVLAIGITVYKFGFKEVKDTVVGHATKTMLEGEWVASSYGFPPIDIETPEVLLRQETESSAATDTILVSHQVFASGSYDDLFSVTVSSSTLKQEAEPNFELAVGSAMSNLEKNGLRNIIPKQEEFFTTSGVQGLKTYGSGQMKAPEGKNSRNLKYAILTFGGNGFVQQIVMTWEDGDEYAEQIVQRISASVDVKTQV